MRADLLESQPHVVLGHMFDVERIFGSFFAQKILAQGHCRFDLGEKGGEVAEFHVINGTTNRAAVLVAQDENQFRARHLAGKLHAAQQILVHKVSCDTAHEDIADALIKDVLHRHAAVQTA